MSHILVELISEMTQLTPDESLAIEESFPIKTYPKGTILLKVGQVAKEAYFVISGCIRNYEILEGEEKTWDFYTDHQSAANFNSLVYGSPSTKNMVCSEETTVAIVNTKKEQELYTKFPRFETFCRTGMEQMFGTQQEEMSKFSILSPEDKYQHVLKKRPGLINRVPQYQLASYLGIKPETLSRIRKRISEKKLN
ncbi:MULTISPECIES: Crp/Fnr family transcriptional regulator [Reichenbachiella]|uniref:Crp/Fnr family transcriptional regulator n=1 Tax=Reichenbachiella TaxID=156993 RepID=UPI000E6BD595|nr:MULTISPECIES: Crp/Fnr family transcriptional regulator [Reichenbachiella]MBU2912832.1 Crp/Fnr family transcriptional regulator [Reichenbachiella agariperforans]RJE70654.1 cyclic nucleotide-binding protein [Reichenbachiella sp. MSK19-1]